MSEEMEFGPDLMTLQDEPGHEHEFEVADTLEDNDERYMAMMASSFHVEELLEDDGELVILKVVQEDEEEFLEAIEDEEEFNHVSAIFMERLQDDYDIHE